MNKYIVSVGEVVLRNIATKDIIAIGTTAVDTSFALTATKTDVRGGPGNSILYSYVSERTFDVNITQASFNKEVLALNAGSLIKTGVIDYIQTDCIELDSGGVGTLSKSPKAGTDVIVVMPDNLRVTVTPSGTSITVPGGANLAVYAAYTTTVTAESLEISASAPPSMVDLIYTAEVRDETGAIVEYMQIHVPKLQLSGNYTLTFNANGVANEAIEGSAMSTKEGGCGLGGGYYARVAWVPASGTVATSYNLIAATPSDWDFSVAGGLPASKQVEVLGIPNDGIRANVVITSDCTFAKEAGGATTITVSAGGLVTASISAIAGQSAVIIATHTPTGLTDRCIFQVVA